ncbi:LysM peptidoglycan-binding domain-containing protein [Weissella confusa]|uniref:LysM peptidoglycan-binding domain-containing protein n=1 Tax=Weissella confusa TaxID=1583 RepID=UPI0018F14A08|nr:LysM domain-containing protein [Weissella confusa]
MKNKTLGNKLFKSGKVLIAVAGVSVIITNAAIPVISTVSANTNKVTPVHTASNWRANDQKNVDNNMRSQGIDSINDLSNYNVVWGDTLTTIANHFHTTADELKNKFNIVNADFIVAGFELSNQSQFNSIGRELLSSSITSLNKNTTSAYLQKPTNLHRLFNSNNSTSNTEQKQVVAVKHDYSVTDNHNVTDKAATDKAAADKAAADKAAAEQAAADKAATDKAAAEQAAADKAAAEQAAADKAAAEQAAADKAAAEQAAADKAAADKAAADKAAADKAAADKAAADKAAADKAAADKAAADKAAADKAAADKAAADLLNNYVTARGIDTVGKYAGKLYVAFDYFDYFSRTVTGIKVSEGNGLTTSYTEKQLQDMGFNVNVFMGAGLYAYLPANENSRGWDTSDLTVSLDVKLNNGQTTTLMHKITPSPSNNADDESAAPLNVDLAASGTNIVGQYAKRLFVSLSGFDARPITVTGIKVSEGNGLTTSYTEKQLQDMGFNVNVASGLGSGLYAYLPAKKNSRGWDTSDLTVSLDVKLNNGQTTTIKHKVIASSIIEMDEIPVVKDGSIIYSNGNRYDIAFGSNFTDVYSNGTSFSKNSDGTTTFRNNNGIVTVLNNDGSISDIYYNPQSDAREGR